MFAMIITGAVALVLALAAGAYRLAFWRGVTGHPRAGRIHHVSYSPGFELSAYENAMRAMHRIERENARARRNQPTEP